MQKKSKKKSTSKDSSSRSKKKRTKNQNRIIRLNLLIKSVIPKNSKNSFYMYVGMFITCIIIMFTFFLFTRRDAYDILVDDVFVASMSSARGITANEFEEAAISKLEGLLSKTIRVNESVTFVRVNSRGRTLSTTDHVVLSIANALTYDIQAYNIVINGVVVASASSRREAESLLYEVKAPYTQDSFEVVESSFVQDVYIQEAFISPDSLLANYEILAILTSQIDITEVYIVSPGDNLWSISNRLNTPIDAILRDNPGISESSPIFVGMELNVTVPTPMLSVNVVREVTHNEVIPSQSQVIENPSLPQNTSSVLQEGVTGISEITKRSTYLNGVLISSEVVAERVVQEPVDRISQVGTGTV
jgi:accessory gene regulator protein AgrB